MEGTGWGLWTPHWAASPSLTPTAAPHGWRAWQQLPSITRPYFWEVITQL